MIKEENLQKSSLSICIHELSKEFPKDSKTNLSQTGKRVIGVRVIEILLYTGSRIRCVTLLADKISEPYLRINKIVHLRG